MLMKIERSFRTLTAMDARHGTNDSPAGAEVLTKPQLEDQLNLSAPTVTKLLSANEFPNAFKVVKRWRIPVTDVEQFKKRHQPQRATA